LCVADRKVLCSRIRETNNKLTGEENDPNANQSNLSKPPQTQEVLHNRWHPDIPMIAYVKPGDEFTVECVDWTGGQIANDDVANDVRDTDLTKVHYLSGPIGVEGAEPGDLLVVDILDIGVLPESAWGSTGIFAKTNGGGFLTNHYPDALKACWDFHGIIPLHAISQVWSLSESSTPG
jgi:formamidase